jgi:hypothetical protein
MRDPHVKYLFFEIGSGEATSYVDPERLSFTNHLGKFGTSGTTLTVEPTDHFADEASARFAIEQYLRGWEIITDLAHGIETVRFKFVRTEIIDRNPPPPGTPQSFTVRGTGPTVGIRGSGKISFTRRKYPEPPASFAATPDVQHVHKRWLDFRAGREPLQSMAYFVLTVMQEAGGSRTKASKMFGIDRAVLDKLGELTSTRGDAGTARKAPAAGSLSVQERQWLDGAVQLIIRRLGEHASGQAFPLVTMADLPPMKP